MMYRVRDPSVEDAQMRLLAVLLPAKFFYADRLTRSARLLMTRLAVALIGLAVVAGGVGLLNGDNWADVVAGALFAWATSLVLWAVNSYRTRTEDVTRDLRHMAEVDLLHARLNHIASKMELPMLDLQAEIEGVLRAREERLAHFAGLDEFRATGEQPSADWWDRVALGMHD